jgi:hypothetical protein
MSDDYELPLTWREFKAYIDRLLEERGISEDTPVSYIDISLPDKKHNEPVLQFSDSGIGIT